MLRLRLLRDGSAQLVCFGSDDRPYSHLRLALCHLSHLSHRPFCRVSTHVVASCLYHPIAASRRLRAVVLCCALELCAFQSAWFATAVAATPTLAPSCQSVGAPVALEPWPRLLLLLFSSIRSRLCARVTSLVTGSYHHLSLLDDNTAAPQLATRPAHPGARSRSACRLFAAVNRPSGQSSGSQHRDHFDDWPSGRRCWAIAHASFRSDALQHCLQTLSAFQGQMCQQWHRHHVQGM